MIPLADIANLSGSTETISGAGIVLVVWLAVAPILFLFFRPLRALCIAFVFGYLFLPHTAINTPFVIYDKLIAVSLGALLGSVITDARRWKSLRPHWVDIPVLLWCLVAALSPLSNNLEAYDIAAAFTRQTILWAIPYFLGRLYLNNLTAMREMAKIFFIGGLIYMPLCLLEVRLSPFLHYELYRIWQHNDILQAFRDGGFRPMVFLQHGLAVGMYMAAATLLGCWLWWTGSLRKIFGLPMWLPVLAMIVTTVLVKSTGATILLFAGLLLLLLTRRIRHYVLIYLVLLVPAGYIAMRTLGGWTGATAITYASEWFGPDRGQSLQFRMDNENLYVQHDAQRPWLGFGPGFTFLIFTDYGTSLVVDSMWIITLSVNGIVGLAAFLLMTAVPIAVALWRIPPKWWGHPVFAAAGGLIGVLVIASIDNLANAMANPVFTLALGGVAALAIRPLVREPVERGARKKTRKPAGVPTVSLAPQWQPKLLPLPDDNNGAELTLADVLAKD